MISLKVLNLLIPRTQKAILIKPCIFHINSIWSRRSHNNDHTLRSHTCGELCAKNVGESVTICGWLQFHRMDKFAILRDAFGTTQVVISEQDDSLKEKLRQTPLESVVLVSGTVSKRPTDQINKDMSTGEIEINTDKFQVLNEVTTQLPFNLRDHQKPNEFLRMKYRYLDLRFEQMQNNLRLRSDVVSKMRNFLTSKKGFIEVETPTLFKNTPGGAQEFLVPTQFPGKFYSLVQSPQQLKQMLMVGGIDRYFQIARCYRDESSRPDRQPEFTQLDLEFSFTDADGVMNLTESLLQASLPEGFIRKMPFKKITHYEALEKYGTDKPDLSINIHINELKNIEVNDGYVARFFKIPQAAIHFSNSKKQNCTKLARSLCPKSWFRLITCPGTDFDKLKNSIPGFKGTTESLTDDLNVQELDLIFLAVGPRRETLEMLGKFRSSFINELRERGVGGEWEMKSDSFENNIIWVVDFPLFELAEDTISGIKSSHHPFTSPNVEDISLLCKDPLKMRGLHYDLVMNGWEIGGGSVRIHDPKLQEKILDILGIAKKDFSHLIEALASGAPPHAGIALGVDRLISLLVEAKSIRDVIAFPKSSDGKDLLSGSPSTVDKADLSLYNIEIINDKNVQEQPKCDKAADKEHDNKFERSGSIRKVLHSLTNSESLIGFSAKMLDRPKGKTTEKYNSIREYSILNEYKMLGRHLIPGLYAIPSATSGLTWFGIIFVKEGLYKNGVFRFKLQIPDNFPDTTPPKLFFDTPVYHPSVDESTNQLNVNAIFTVWSKNNQLWEVLKYAHSIFYDVKTSYALNESAAKLYEKNRNQFTEIVRDCIEASIAKIYEPVETDDAHSIVISEYDDEIHSESKNKFTKLKLGYENDTVSCKGFSWIERGSLKPCSRRPKS